MSIKKMGLAALTGTMLLGMSSVAFAGNADDMLDKDNVVLLFGTDKDSGEATGWLNLNGYSVTDVYGVTYTVELDQAELDDEKTWIGGGVGWNSDSTSWASTEWGKASGEKPIKIEDTLDGTTATITVKSDKPVFAETDEWAQCWIQCWGGKMTVKGVDVLGEDGNPLEAGEAAGTTAGHSADISYNAPLVITSADVPSVAENPTIKVTGFGTEGTDDAYWNDWCVIGVEITQGGETTYKAVGGKQVGWDVSFTEDELCEVPNSDIIFADDDNSAIIKLGKLEGDDWTVTVKSMGWDNAPDCAYFTADYDGMFAADAAVAEEDSALKADVSYNAPFEITSKDIEAVAENPTLTITGFGTEGTDDAYWNDWCAVGIEITQNGETTYKAVGGKQVGWDISFTEEELAEVPQSDVIFVGDDNSAIVKLGKLEGDWSVKVRSMGWDNAPDCAYFTVDCTNMVGTAAEPAGDGEEDGTTAKVSYNTPLEITSKDVDPVSANPTLTITGFGTEGTDDAYWNDWCAVGIEITQNGETTYKAVGGKQVGWDISFTEEELAEVPQSDIIIVDDDNSAIVKLGKLEGDWTVKVRSMGWDNAPDCAYFTVDYSNMFGEAAEETTAEETTVAETTVEETTLAATTAEETTAAEPETTAEVKNDEGSSKTPIVVAIVVAVVAVAAGVVVKMKKK